MILDENDVEARSHRPLGIRLTDEAGRLAGQLTSPDAGAAPLDAVAKARRLALTVEEALRMAVERARDTGHTWQEIGEVLGTSRQAAFQRFGRPIDPRTGAPMAEVALPHAAERAVALFVHLVERRWEDVRRDFDATMSAKIGADEIAAVWAQVAGTIGGYQRMGEPFSRQLGDYTTVDVPLFFEAGEAVGQVSFDDRGRVAGLFIRPSAGP